MTAIRTATVDDLPACAAIINDYIDTTEWLPRTLSRETLTDLFSPGILEKRVIFVADTAENVAGKIAGYLSMDNEAGFIHAIYLVPGERSKGLGKLLLDAAKQTHPQGIELTVFEPNSGAMRFYKREGFVERPEGRKDDTEENVPTRLMRWEGSEA